jgi:hypothetical protein
MVLADSLTVVFHDWYADAVLQQPFRARVDIQHLELEATTDQGQQFVDEQLAQVTP